MPRFRNLILFLIAGAMLSLPASCKKSEDLHTFYADEPDNATWRRLRLDMVHNQLKLRDIRDKKVLAVMSKVPRHRFVPGARRRDAYGDHPLPIGHGQTISQPYIVALMTQLLELKGGEKVLEIGTGSAYQTAVLAEIVGHVYSVEIVRPLCERSRRVMREMGYRNVDITCGDGYRGRPEHAPFDAILVAAAPPRVPKPLTDQLKIGGRLVIPVGRLRQELLLIRKTRKGLLTERKLPVMFVPMTGKARDEKTP